MNKQMILGIPWLSKENPHIDWTQAAVVMKKGQDWISLPLAKSQQQDPVHLATEISATQLEQDAQEKRSGTSFPGDYPIGQRRIQRGWKHRRSPRLHKKPKWDQALPSHIRAVLEEFDDVFPQDLPLGLPPVRQGHEFRIDLEDDVSPSPSPSIQDEPARVGRGKEAN